MSKLELLLKRQEEAQAAARAEMLRLHPPGSDVRFTIMHGQRNASTGKVVGVGYRPGTLRVQHYEAKPYSRYAYRELDHTQVLP